MKLFKFIRDGREVTIRSSQVTLRNIQSFFRVESDLFLKENSGDRLEFPGRNGEFELAEYPDRSVFNVIVTGDQTSNASISPPNDFRTPSTPNTSASTTTSSSTTPRRRILAVVKVIRADIGMDGKPTNFHGHNLSVHVNIYNDDQACIPYIEGKIREEMEDEDLVLVGPSGLIIYDQDGTRGLSFWKVGSRKVFAVSKRAVEEYREAMDLNGSNAALPPIKRKRSSEGCETSDILEKLCNEMKEVKQEMAKFRSLAFRHKFSASFLSELEGCFSCVICKRVPAKKPLIGCTECSTVIGCENCVNQWYSGANNGMQRKCPKCRCERGLAKTIVLRGFDHLLDQIEILQENGSSSDEENDNDLPIVL